jgi:hypothetical protein
MPSPPRTVVEPTCGTGAFLAAAARKLPGADLAGYEINPRYVDVAAARIPGPGRSVKRADFFTVDWERELAARRGPILVTGNPPWVTRAELGALGSANVPAKQNLKGLRGLDALTGKSNFDVSEWMILRLLAALSGAEATVAMLCKSAVARRVVELVTSRRWPVAPGAMWRIDAGHHFDASVDAVLFTCHLAPAAPPGPVSWPVYPSLDDNEPESAFGVADGTLVADLDAYTTTKALAGASDPEWRSGIKHDCARVMELERRGDGWVNGDGELVEVEPEYQYPLFKSSDVAQGRPRSDRSVIVPQRQLREDTTSLCARAPKLWAYLSRYRSLLDGRRSSIYRGQPPFAVFGVGQYSFAPWKVAISGLYKRMRFLVLGPEAHRPAMVDDTCYLLPFSSEEDARRAARALASDLAAEFFRARVFWDAKRPVNKAILQALDLRRLQLALGSGAT